MPEGKIDKIKCTKRNNSSELTGVRKWLKENLLLLETLFGVIIGTILGIVIIIKYVIANY